MSRHRDENKRRAIARLRKGSGGRRVGRLGIAALAALLLTQPAMASSSDYPPAPDTTIAPAAVGDASVTINPASHDYGEVEVGTSVSQTFTVTNVTDNNLTVPAKELADPFEPSLDGNGCSNFFFPDGLPPGESCTFEIVFVPQQVGSASHNMIVHLGDATTVTVLLSGTGIPAPGTPALTVSPDVHDFGEVVVGEYSAPQTFTVTNNTREWSALHIDSPGGSFLSADPDEDDTCGDLLEALTSCSIAFRFRADMVGEQSGNVTVSAVGAVASLQLLGTGVEEDGDVPLLFSPTAHDFGDVAYQSERPTFTFTLTNNTAENLTIDRQYPTSIFFTAGGTCGDTIGAGASCTTEVAARTGVAGPHTANLTVTGGDYEAIAELSINVVEPSATAVDVPEAVGFSVVPIGGYAEVPHTITNLGEDPITIGVPSLPGGITAHDNACWSEVLAPGASCRVILRYQPTTAESLDASIEFDIDPIGTYTTQLTGRGQEVTPDTPSQYGNITVGHEIVREFTMVEPGIADFAVDLDGVVAPFHVISGCDDPVDGCAPTIAFRPQTTERASAPIIISRTDGSYSMTVLLEGTGVPAAVTVADLDFGSVEVGSSATEMAMIINHGLADLTITEVDVDNDAFTVVDDSPCVTTLGPGVGCQVEIEFAPTAVESEPGSLSVTHLAGTTSSTLSGSGAPIPPQAEVTETVSFAALAAGWHTDVAHYITNTGGSPLIVSGLPTLPSGVSAPEGTDCWSAPIAPGKSCRVLLRYAPTEPGTLDTSITFETNAGSHDTRLVGTAVPNPPDTGSDFGAVTVGHEYVREFPFQAIGGTEFELDLSGIVAPFHHLSGCEPTAEPGVDCTAEVAFRPTAPGSASGEVILRQTDGDYAITAVITGTGAPAVIDVPDADLGDVAVGSTGTATVNLVNGGDADVELSGVSTAAPFAVVDDSPCVTTLAPGASCAVDVEFAPTAPDPATGTLTVEYVGGSSSGVLSGNGTVSGGLTFEPGSLGFGDVTVGDSAEHSVTIMNDLNVPTEVTELSLGAAAETALADALGWDESTPRSPAALADGAFQLDPGDCAGRVLDPGESCTVTVQFTPPAAGAASTVLTVNSSEADGAVGLRGNGVEPPPDTAVPPTTEPPSAPPTRTEPPTTAPTTTAPPPTTVPDDTSTTTTTAPPDDATTTTTPAPPSPDPDTTLPVTGAAGNLAMSALALGLLGVGSILVAGTRRRTT